MAEIQEGASYEKKIWYQHLHRLKERVSPICREAASSVLADAFFKAVASRYEERCAVLFSGGVDSTAIAYALKKQGADFFCVTVGLKGSEDLLSARKVARALELELVERELSLEEADHVIIKTIGILEERSDAVNVGVGSVVVAALEAIKDKGVRSVFSGLGSEEIFAGYHRHEIASDINQECWSGLFGMWERDMVRDSRIASAYGVKFLTPFLDDDLIIKAMGVPPDLKIKSGVKKFIFRQAMMVAGLAEEYAARPKKAAQYGSNFDKALLKCAKKAGFRYRKDYIRSIIRRT